MFQTINLLATAQMLLLSQNSLQMPMESDNDYITHINFETFFGIDFHSSSIFLPQLVKSLLNRERLKTRTVLECF